MSNHIITSRDILTCPQGKTTRQELNGVIDFDFRSPPFEEDYWNDLLRKLREAVEEAAFYRDALKNKMTTRQELNGVVDFDFRSPPFEENHWTNLLLEEDHWTNFLRKLNEDIEKATFCRNTLKKLCEYQGILHRRPNLLSRL